MFTAPAVGPLDAAATHAVVALDCGARVASELTGRRVDLDGVTDDEDDDVGG